MKVDLKRRIAFIMRILPVCNIPIDDVQLDIGKLAMWRLHTHEQFGGTWLSDYVPNRLGGFVLCEEECDESEEMGMEMM